LLGPVHCAMTSEPAAIDQELEAVPVPPHATIAPSRSAGPVNSQRSPIYRTEALTPVGVIGG
jgi:hypothetical protein